MSLPSVSLENDASAQSNQHESLLSGRRAKIKTGLREHGLPLLLFTLFSLALSWPVAAYFGEKIPMIGDGYDPRHNLWILWHTKEAFLGHQPLFSAALLYYPSGASLLTHGLGPITGFFSLPFWFWGAEAAHNGALLVSFILTGYCMYLLARGLGMSWSIAFFAGLVLLTAPMHLAGLYGHMTKVFMGLIPLALLTLHYMLNLNRSRWWAVGTALIVLATLLHNGYQFVYVILAMVFFIVWAFVTRKREDWMALAVRSLWLGVSMLVIVGPLFLAIMLASRNVTVSVDLVTEGFRNQPDVAEIILPPINSRLFGGMVGRFLRSHNIASSIEKFVSISVTGFALCGIALLAARKRSLPWIVLLAGCLILTLGPTLKILSRQHFTTFNLPVMMPYAILTEVPGLDFMRAPGRFMSLGYVSFGIAAALGLNILRSRWPRMATPLVLGAAVLILVETWPQSWPMGSLHEVPAFYKDLAADPETYGVLDLPIKPTESRWYPGHSSIYQIYQMTHNKGIASGYLSRAYDVHPIFPCLIPDFRPADDDVLVDGQAVPCHANLLFELNFHDYRYVVRHKPQPGSVYAPGSLGEVESQQFIDLFFVGQQPLIDDNLVTVYAVPQVETADLSPVMGLKYNWHGSSGAGRWAKSPAELFLSIPRPISATLEFVPHAIYDPDSDNQLGEDGVLDVTLDGELLVSVTIHAGEVTRIPLTLPAGTHTLTLSLAAGNFRPSDYGNPDSRELSFATRYLNLIIEE